MAAVQILCARMGMVTGLNPAGTFSRQVLRWGASPRPYKWTAVINGSLAPFLQPGILLVENDEKIICGQSGLLFARSVVTLTTVMMFVAAIAMCVFQGAASRRYHGNRASLLPPAVLPRARFDS